MCNLFYINTTLIFQFLKNIAHSITVHRTCRCYFETTVAHHLNNLIFIGAKKRQTFQGEQNINILQLQPNYTVLKLL